MKIWLIASFVLNIALSILAGFEFLRKPPVTEATQAEPHDSRSGAKLAATPVKLVQQAFQWSQIESEDFPTYVANLRSIGCPEATIRDLVAAEMKSIFDEKRRAVAERNPGRAGQRAAQIEYQKIDQEEKKSIAAAVGGNNARKDPASVASRNSDRRSTAPTPRIIMPAALQGMTAFSSPAAAFAGTTGTGNAAQPALTPDQLQTVQRVAEQFVQDIGGPNQNPADPAYQQRWQKAQAKADDLLRVQLGWTGYNAYWSALSRQQTQAAANPTN